MDSHPNRPFQDPREVLKTHLASVAAGSSISREDTLTYRVSGGPPGKRLFLRLSMSGSGAATYEHSDEMKAEKLTRTKTTLPKEEIRSVFQQVHDSRLLDQADTGSGFLPDSLIGSLSVRSGDVEVTYHFLAEEYQQQTQQKKLSPAIQRLKPLLENLREVIQNTSRKDQPKTEDKKRR